MARIRSIKPEFWQDELVGTLRAETRLLFIGLWNIADDDGRFRANHLFIRSQLFPYDPQADVASSLESLESAGRIQLYEADGQSFGWVCNFKTHQRIDKPKASTLPAPPANVRKTRPRRIQDASKNGPGRKGVEGNGVEQGGEQVELAADATEPAGNPKSLLPVLLGRAEVLQELWNARAHPSLPRWKGLSKPRRAAADARIKEAPTFEHWASVIDRMNQSKGLRGENDRGWKASPDWFLQADSSARILEGKYDNWGRSTRVNGRALESDKDWSDVPDGPDYCEPFEATS